MQKVSKQSLAMIALSILLAISIALTFTFAALSAQKEITGTIQFSGGKAIVLNGAADDATYTFNIAYTVGDEDTATAVITKTGEYTTAWADATIGLAASSANGTLKVAIKYTDTTTENVLKNYVKLAATSYNLTQGSAATKKLSDIIVASDIKLDNTSSDFATLANATGLGITVTFTIE